MKAVIEFGVRRGAHVDNLVFPSAKLAVLTAARIVMVLSNDPYAPGANVRDWKVNKTNPRDTFSSLTHFVAVSLLDGVMRGPAAAALWRAPGPREIAEHNGGKHREP